MTQLTSRRSLGLLAALMAGWAAAQAGPGRAYDVALILAVDVSGSVDEARYRVQMEGIARALEDEDVVKSILGGENGAILVSLLAWSDTSKEALPWQEIASKSDALLVARAIRELPHTSGEFTCMARMMRDAREGLFRSIPGTPAKQVLDVSGDGPDNCSGAARTEEERDKLAAAGVTINGLPIRNGNDFIGTGAYRAPGFGWEELKREPHMEGVTIEDWYRLHVIGGPAAFLVTGDGYDDFGNAFRRKFVTEISGAAGSATPGHNERLAGLAPPVINSAIVKPGRKNSHGFWRRF